MKPFHFKQFSIQQSKDAFKIGTDALLLGGWHDNIHQPKEILDIGTGTGIVALMAAQRAPHSKITAIELQSESAKIAHTNFQQSSFSDQITLFPSSLQEFVPSQPFDLILCNPPFFDNSTLSANSVSKIARHTDHLSAQDVLEFAQNHLSPTGVVCMVIPIDILKQLHTSLPLHSIIKFKATKDKPVKRVVVSWSVQNVNQVHQQEVIIEEKRHHFTDAYIQKMKDFHPFL